MNETARWYHSKVDPWMALVMAIAPVVTIVTGVTVAASTDARPADVAAAFIPLALLVILAVVIGFPVRYGVTGQTLIVRMGLVRWRIPLDQIVEVLPSRSLESAPALSFDRLLIRHGPEGKKRMLISPDDRAGFLDTLARHAGLRHEGTRLVRNHQTHPGVV